VVGLKAALTVYPKHGDSFRGSWTNGKSKRMNEEMMGAF